MSAHGSRLLLVAPLPCDPDAVAAWLTSSGFRVDVAGALPEALSFIGRGGYDVILSPPAFPGEAAHTSLQAIRDADPDAALLVWPNSPSFAEAVQVGKLGASDYLSEPMDSDGLAQRCRDAADTASRRSETGRRVSPPRRDDLDEMIGRSPAMMELVRLIKRIGPSDKPVLIEGESGTGKELVARALQRASVRSTGPFVAINCAALPEQLLESEFFGHEKGAFTGAAGAKPGLFEAADGGTLFVDEIGELAPVLQAKLLRVLENGCYRRVGSVAERRADVRVIAATNRNLAAEVAAGRFREDLYYRINVVSIRLPSLRDRRGDVPRLVEAFLGRDFQLDDEARAAVERFGWPGNVRQLKNALDRAKVLAVRDVIRLCDLPTEVAIGADVGLSGATGDDIESQQREHVLRILAREHGNKSRTARILGVDRRSLYRMLDRYHRARPTLTRSCPTA